MCVVSVSRSRVRVCVRARDEHACVRALSVCVRAAACVRACVHACVHLRILRRISACVALCVRACKSVRLPM